MGAGEKIDHFAEAVQGTLADLKARLPQDLIIARTSDQPEQVKENVDLFMDSAVRSRRPGRGGLADRFLGVAIRAAHGALDPDHAADDLRHDVLLRYRPSAGVDRDADHRARTAGGRSGGGWRRHQTGSRAGSSAADCGLARTHQAGQGDHVRYGDQHRGVPAVPAAVRQHGTVSVFASGGDHLLADRFRVVSMTFIPLLGYYLLRPKAEPVSRSAAAKDFPRRIIGWANGRSRIAGGC